MSAYSPPLTDIGFLLAHLTPIAALASYPPYRHVDTALSDAVIQAAARLAEEVLGPLNRVGDDIGSLLRDGRVVTPPGFRAAYQSYVEGGWVGLDLPTEHGGQALPRVLQTAVAEMVNGACVSFGMLPLMERAATKVLIAHAEPLLRDRLVPHLVSGQWGATIAMSEAGAGSDVGRVRTRALRQADGSYALTGSKVFITYGDQDFTEQIIHLVLARVPDAPPGVKGLSLFAVPARRLDAAGNPAEPNRVSVSRVEKKMGLKASPTCVVDFDAAVGYLIGAEQDGLRNIFTMVNTMRIEVAIQGVGIAGAATAKAIAYALARPQGGSAERDPLMLIEHPDIRRMLMTMQARTGAMRALIYETSYQLDLAEVLPTPEQREESQLLAEWLLPVCKAGGSEAGFEVANLGVQIHGGYGYVADAGVEQYVRDSRVMSIYEGANGIQAIDLATRRLQRQQGRSLDLFIERIRRDLSADSGHGTELIQGALARELLRLRQCSDWMLSHWPDNPRDALAGASAYLGLVVLVAGGWMWLRMARVNDPDQPRRLVLARFYAEYLMPDGAALATRATSGAATIDAVATADWASRK